MPRMSGLLVSRESEFCSSPMSSLGVVSIGGLRRQRNERERLPDFISGSVSDPVRKRSVLMSFLCESLLKSE